MFLFGVAGAGVGTFAWFSYNQTASAEFSGTVIGVGNSVEIGIRSDERLLEYEEHYENDFDIQQMWMEEFEVSDTDTDYIYWVRSNYLKDVLAKYAELTSHATDQLTAITAGSYSEAAQASWEGFRKTPTTDDHIDTGEADTDDYFYLPLAFRVTDNSKDDQGETVYLDNQNIYLTAFSTTDNQAGANSPDLGKALRCKVDYPLAADTGFIFDPNNDQAVNLKVGGPLNLNHDAYLDYDEASNKEVAYGYFDGDFVYGEAVTADPTIEYKDCNTFVANHKKGILPVDTTNAKTCQTRNNSLINPIMDDDDGGQHLVTTGGDSKIALVDLTVFLEGWDENVIDQALSHSFEVSIEFSVK